MLFISDANIFIDLQKIGLLELFDKLEIEIATSDFVFSELNTLQQEIVKNLNIAIYSMDANELVSFYREFSDKNLKKISYQDYSIFYFAKKYNGELLSNDKRLREYAKKQKVSVKGVFFIIDKMVDKELVDKDDMIKKLRLLQKINKRIPLKEIESRIQKWSKL